MGFCLREPLNSCALDDC